MGRTPSHFSVFGFIIIFVLALVILVGPPVYLELTGRTAAGVIIERREEIRVQYLEWSRWLHLEVRYTPADTEKPEIAVIPVTVERYDRAQVGDPVQIRYLLHPQLRAVGLATPRLVDQGPLGQLRSVLDIGPIATVLLGLFLALAAAWQLTRRRWLLVPLVGMLVLFAMYLTSSPPMSAPPGLQRTTQATVRLVYEVDRLAWRGNRYGDLDALQPYQIVALEFVPEGTAGTVVAVDQIDVGSVPGVEVGANLPIRYSAADPRWARIEGGQQTYFWKNLYLYAIIAGVLLLFFICGFWLLSRNKRTRRQRGHHP
jgi:hypothetical protein